MNAQAQQIALCEWMGWKRTKLDPDYDWHNPDGGYANNLPNTNSLDVLHEMEKKLTEKQLEDYKYQLQKVCEPEGYTYKSAICSSAPQRREALLRTLNLWKE